LLKFFTEEFEDNIYQDEAPSDLKTDYLFYEKTVITLLKQGCKIQSIASVVSTSKQRSQLRWADLQATVTLASSCPSIICRKEARNKELFHNSVPSAKITKDIPFPNQLAIHRKTILPEENESTKSLSMKPSRNEQRLIQIFCSHRDLSLFGSYMTLPKAGTSTSSIRAMEAPEVKINRECLRASDFRTPPFYFNPQDMALLKKEKLSVRAGSIPHYDRSLSRFITRGPALGRGPELVGINRTSPIPPWLIRRIQHSFPDDED
jgi:hypothetical protein